MNHVRAKVRFLKLLKLNQYSKQTFEIACKEGIDAPQPKQNLKRERFILLKTVMMYQLPIHVLHRGLKIINVKKCT